MIESFAIGSDTWPGLAKLLEELGELQQVIGKLIAFPDPNAEHPDGQGSLARRLEDELADVNAAVQYVRAHNGSDRLDPMRLQARLDRKFARFQRWDGEERRGVPTTLESE